MFDASAAMPLLFGVSACLTGQKVRYDGGHKQHPYVARVLQKYCRLLPICPETESGLTTPRPPLHLQGIPDKPRLVVTSSGEDITEAMEKWCHTRLQQLKLLSFSGFILKKSSPSCGLEDLPVYPDNDAAQQKKGSTEKGTGIFAKDLQRNFPRVPVIQEDALGDEYARNDFLDRVFLTRRWHVLLQGGITPQELCAFHTSAELVLLAHSPEYAHSLSACIAKLKTASLGTVLPEYESMLHTSLAIPSSQKTHLKVLEQLYATIQKSLPACKQADIEETFQGVGAGQVSRSVLLGLLQKTLDREAFPVLAQQWYLAFDPVESALRQ